jgi:hypothetical protein
MAGECAEEFAAVRAVAVGAHRTSLNVFLAAITLGSGMAAVVGTMRWAFRSARLAWLQ